MLGSLETVPESISEPIRDALSWLGIERLVLAIHDQSFPSADDEDLGRGSPYGREARRLLEFIRGLGFDGVQLGPQGATSRSNPSPYDGALFTKSVLSVELFTLAEDPAWAPLCTGLLAPRVDGRPAGPANRVQYAHAWQASHALVTELHQRFERAAGRRDPAAAALTERFRAFVAASDARLAPDGVFEALAHAHGTDDWRAWPDLEVGAIDRSLPFPPGALAEQAARRRAELGATYPEVTARHLFGQFVLDEQHRALRRAVTEPAGLMLYADLQIGLAHRDVWSWRGLFRDDYLMGAPPSRTNPEGQAWGFPVFDPARTFEAAGPGRPARPGPVLELQLARIDRALVEFDGLRIDHPHGWVCPWVYDARAPDPAAAVARGARLFCSPNLADHPALAALAIAEPGQLTRDPGLPLYADDWVSTLREDQVSRYGALFDAVLARVRAAGRQVGDVVCEVLSTWPYPLRRVMARHALGRFVVTQKADLTRADDVYRAENASELDWIMVGNHDTPPLAALARSWHGTASGSERAAYLAERLIPHPALRARFARWVAAEPGHLFAAMMAQLFATRARRVSVFFADLFGLEDTYNRPGIVDARNWTLRLASSWRRDYLEAAARGMAFNVPLALALALLARPEASAPARAPERATERATIIARLVRAAQSLWPALDADLLDLLATAAAPTDDLAADAVSPPAVSTARG